MNLERENAELRAQLAEKDARIRAQEALVVRLLEENKAQAEQIATLGRQVEALTEKLGRNSNNSHRPPSSDPPGSKGRRVGGKKSNKRGKGKSGRKRGGQPGHQGTSRAQVPPEEVSEFVELFPSKCADCFEPLENIPDPSPTRHQVIDVPPVRPEVVEFRRHQVSCKCGYKTRAAYDEKCIPASPFGPRLMALVALLSGVYHVSRRSTQALLHSLMGVKISLGAISKIEARVSQSVRPAVDEVLEHVQQADVKHTDGTSWYTAGVMRSLWTIATSAATWYKIVANGRRVSLEPLFGQLRGILVSDRAKALDFWVMHNRQICWSHLLRRFVSFSERAGPAGQIGSDLLNYTGLMFQYWQDYKDGKLERHTFVAWMAPVRTQLEDLLTMAAGAEIAGLSGSCKDILKYKVALWTFLCRDDVDPTNNHAERELRAFVLWRKRSFGAQSERGNLFAERIMTVAHTAKKQRIGPLDFLTACCKAYLDGTGAPSLFAADVAKAA